MLTNDEREAVIARKPVQIDGKTWTPTNFFTDVSGRFHASLTNGEDVRDVCLFPISFANTGVGH